MGLEEKHFSQGLCSPNWGVETDYVYGDLMVAEVWAITSWGGSRRWQTCGHALVLLPVHTDASTLAPHLAASSPTQVGDRPRQHPLQLKK